MMDLIFGGMITAPFAGLGMVSIYNRQKRKKKEEAEMLEYNWHFPKTYWHQTEIYPVSSILLAVVDNKGDFKPWMGEIKRYEGNRIESEEIQERFWLNLVLVNEKYDAYKRNTKSYEEYKNYKIDEFVENYSKQLDALRQDIIDRCYDCYEMMKMDSVAERQERLVVFESVRAPGLAEKGFVASEEKALLNILESPRSTPEMRQEAVTLLEKWRALHVPKTDVSAEERSMQIDLLTIRNIIEGKETRIENATGLMEQPKQ